jgi:hypothetical protein
MPCAKAALPTILLAKQNTKATIVWDTTQRGINHWESAYKHRRMWNNKRWLRMMLEVSKIKIIG